MLYQIGIEIPDSLVMSQRSHVCHFEGFLVHVACIFQKENAEFEFRNGITRHQDGMCGIRIRRPKGIDIETETIEKAGDVVSCRRFKLRGMHWSRSGANAL